MITTNNFNPTAALLYSERDFFYNINNRATITDSGSNVAGATWTRTYTLRDNEFDSANGLTYPGGTFFMYFWVGGVPASMSLRVYNESSATWTSSSAGTDVGTSGFGMYRFNVPSTNYVKTFEITFVNNATQGANIQRVEYYPNNTENVRRPVPWVSHGDSFQTFGGSTSSFPALKRSGSILQVRWADDSDFAPLSALSLTAGSTTALTATAPAINVTQTWNNAGVTFTGLKLNVTDTTSAAASLLMDLQVGGTSQFSVTKGGSLNFASGISFNISGTSYARLVTNSFRIPYASAFGWTATGAASDAQDTFIFRDAANIVAQRNLTTNQTFRLYGTYTDGSNYERLSISANSSGHYIIGEEGGTGSERPLYIGSNNSVAMTIGANGNIYAAKTISDRSGDLRSTPISSQTSSYVITTLDNGKTISITTGNVSFDTINITAGQIFSVFNNSNTNQTISQAPNSIMYLAGTNTTGNRIITQYGIATLMCVAANTFVISGAGLS
jgi:hypothetical protein